MPTKTIYIELDDLNLTQGDSDYPELDMMATISFDIHPAEPDVGIFAAEADITEWDLSIDGTSYTTANDFAARLSEELGSSCADTQAEIEEAVKRWIDHETERFDFDD